MVAVVLRFRGTRYGQEVLHVTQISPEGKGAATVVVWAVASCASTIRASSAFAKEWLTNYGKTGAELSPRAKPTADSRQQAVLAQFSVQIALADSQHLGRVSAVTLAGLDRQSDVRELRFFERWQLGILC
jgi:hypothetical protein